MTRIRPCGGALEFLTEEDRASADRLPCCMGVVMDGPDGCTCWVPSFDLEQRPPRTDVAPGTRAKSCHDCAFRRRSPERGRGEELDDLPNFWCHQGIRRPATYTHLDGRVRKVDLSRSPDYRPPMVADVPYRADGLPADRCAGLAAVQATRIRSEA